MMRYKVLAISYFSPPMGSAQAIQVSRLLKHLEATIVLVCGEDHRKRPDHSIAPDMEQYLEYVLRVPFHRSTLLRLIDRLAFEIHIPWSDLPDVYRSWNFKALKLFLKWQKPSGYRPDVVMTFGQPMSDHLFGLEFKKRTGIPWIAHFSDPWVDNPYRLKNPFIDLLNRRMEAQVVEHANALIFTSPETVDLVMRKYPSSWHNKAFYIPHCYDRKLYDPELTPPSNHYVIRLVGNFYGQRTPKPFFEALEQIALEAPELFSNVVLEFVGSWEKINTNPYPFTRKIIHFVGKVSYTESIRLMQTAHCLFVIDAPSNFSVFFPSKLVDYIGTGRFIVAVSPPGAASRIVQDIGGMVADPSDKKAVVRMLKEVLVKRPEKLPFPTHLFDKDVVSNEMMNIIKKTIS